MIGSTKVAPLVREFTKGQNTVDFNILLKKIYDQLPNDLLPVQRAIVECELDAIGFRRRGGSTVFVR